jgi:hypothetical protein
MSTALQEKSADAKVRKLRGTVWYQRYKHLAGVLDGQPIAQVLRTIHQLIDGHNKYGSYAIADSASNSIEQVIKDLELDTKASLPARLRQIVAEAYGSTMDVETILNSLTDEEITQIFSDLYESLLQAGRLKKPDVQLPESMATDGSIAV